MALRTAFVPELPAVDQARLAQARALPPIRMQAASGSASVLKEYFAGKAVPVLIVHYRYRTAVAVALLRSPAAWLKG